MMPISCKYFPADAISLQPTPMNNQRTLSLHVTYDKMKMPLCLRAPKKGASVLGCFEYSRSDFSYPIMASIFRNH
jgi:hypothetical protein